MAGISFPARDADGFVLEVKRRVHEHFTTRGLSTKANAAMVIKTAVLLLLTFGSYGLILTGWFSPWAMLGLGMLVGVGMAGIGFAVTHDALHGAYSSRPLVNAAIGHIFDLIGANGYTWKITHNVIHHTYTNIDGVDGDLTVSPLLRLSPGAPLRWIHRWQHFYAFFAYSLSTLFWVFVKDYKYFLTRRLGPYTDLKHPPAELANMLVSKVVYYGWSIVVPLLVLDVAWWQFAIGYLVMHLTAGFILGVIFQLAHVVEGIEYPLPDDTGKMANVWLVHEMATTANFGRRNRLLTWYVGGLNYQVEHHLFPKVCSVHYPAITQIVEEAARRHGVPYNENPTLFAAVRSHYHMLKRFGPEAWIGRRSTELSVA